MTPIAGFSSADFQFQPSELAKFSLVLLFSHLLDFQ